MATDEQQILATKDGLINEIRRITGLDYGEIERFFDDVGLASAQTALALMREGLSMDVVRHLFSECGEDFEWTPQARQLAVMLHQHIAERALRRVTSLLNQTTAGDARGELWAIPKAGLAVPPRLKMAEHQHIVLKQDVEKSLWGNWDGFEFYADIVGERWNEHMHLLELSIPKYIPCDLPYAYIVISHTKGLSPNSAHERMNGTFQCRDFTGTFAMKIAFREPRGEPRPGTALIDHFRQVKS